MLQQHKWKLLITSLLTLFPILIGLILWNHLPNEIAIHWSADGTANGWTSKWFAVMILPIILFAIHWLCIFATTADPKHKNISPKMFGLVLWICPVMSIFCSGMTYAEALGYDSKIELFTPMLIGLMFIIIGNYLPKCKQSYTLGIRLPWTLQSEENWNKTHRLAGFIWVITGIVFLISAFFKTIWLILIGTILAALIPTVYSYLYYRKYETK